MNLALSQNTPSRLFSLARKTAFGLVATGVLLGTSASALAGKEYDLLNAQLGGSKTVNAIATSSTAAIVAAVNSVIGANPTLKQGVVMGEALKWAGSNAPDIGTALGTQINGTGTEKAVATDAIKTAGSGKGLNVSKVPSFAAAILTGETETDAINLATTVKASKAGTGAVAGGWASTLGNDAAKRTFANNILGPTPKLTAAAQDIAKYITQTVADAAGFTTAVAGNAANAKFADKLVFGIIAGQPMTAGAVTDAALNIDNTAKPGTKLLVPKAAALAKTIGALADIEQIQKVGEQIAKRIGSGALKLSQAASVAKTLGTAIIKKPVAVNQSNINDPLRNDNKIDELGELGAYMLSAISTSAEFTAIVAGKVKNADKTVLALLKTLVGVAKTKIPGTTGPLLDAALKYIAGSIALTVSNLPAGQIKTTIIAALNDPKKVDGIAKGVKVDPAILHTAISDGLAGGNPAGRFENGFDVATGLLTDPETNIRNF